MKIQRPSAHVAVGCFVLLGGACGDSSSIEGAPCMPLAPVQVQLEGILTREGRPGAPGYGETPETDERLEILLLGLSSPISVCPDSAGGITDTLRGVAQIQLSLDPGIVMRTPASGQRVTVEGTLSEGITGPQFTSIVMTVQTLTSHE